MVTRKTRYGIALLSALTLLTWWATRQQDNEVEEDRVQIDARLDYALMGLAPTLAWLLVGRLVAGVVGGSYVTANAYIGCWGIVDALERGADVVITGRATDAAVVAGPAAWHHNWSRDDWDALAGAIVAGHVIECGGQATGGNYSFFTEIEDMTHPGCLLYTSDAADE